jgi:indole-3-glycerol phosphate synthase
MNILDKIIAHKKKEVVAAREKMPASVLEQKPFFSRNTLSLKQQLLNPEKTGIIAEFKRRSPSRGVINAHADVLRVTGSYASNGASGISVLTDENFFGGSPDDLERARENNVPILRKDFITDPYQVVEARAMGADVILLIAACLSPKEVSELAAFAKSLQMEVLLEIHDDNELGHICLEVDMVGVNNRDLKTFTVDVNRSIELGEKIPAGILKVSESGITDVSIIRNLRASGFNGFLVGEKFMMEKDPAIAFASFTNQLKNQR